MVETSQNIFGTTRAERILNITKNRYFNFKFPDFKNRTFCFFNWRASASLSRTIPIPPQSSSCAVFWISDFLGAVSRNTSKFKRWEMSTNWMKYKNDCSKHWQIWRRLKRMRRSRINIVCYTDTADFSVVMRNRLASCSSWGPGHTIPWNDLDFKSVKSPLL